MFTLEISEESLWAHHSNSSKQLHEVFESPFIVFLLFLHRLIGVNKRSSILLNEDTEQVSTGRVRVEAYLHLFARKRGKHMVDYIDLSTDLGVVQVQYFHVLWVENGTQSEDYILNRRN